MNQDPIKILIVDDEPFAREYIRKLLRDVADVEVVGEAGNGKVAAKLIAKCRPDLMFLDIQMPEMDGFALLATLNADDLPVIIFTTAFEEFAIRAFEVHALDYLLKPFDQQRFAQAFEHARARLNERGAPEPETDQIAELLRSIQAKPQYLDRFLIKQNGRIIFLKVGAIDWIKADDKYVHLHGREVKHFLRQTLAAMKAQLDPAQFVQINRSVIVNLDSVKELHAGFNGDYEVRLHDGSTFPLSKNFKNELFELMGKPLS